MTKVSSWRLRDFPQTSKKANYLLDIHICHISASELALTLKGVQSCNIPHRLEPENDFWAYVFTK